MPMRNMVNQNHKTRCFQKLRNCVFGLDRLDLQRVQHLHKSHRIRFNMKLDMFLKPPAGGKFGTRSAKIYTKRIKERCTPAPKVQQIGILYYIWVQRCLSVVPRVLPGIRLGSLRLTKKNVSLVCIALSFLSFLTSPGGVTDGIMMALPQGRAKTNKPWF